MFKVKHDLCPPFMKKLFTYISNENGTRSGDTFARPNVESVLKGEQSLRSFGPKVWNSMLPDSLKGCKSLSEFKTRIKSWIPTNCPCKLCKTYIAGVGYATVLEWENDKGISTLLRSCLFLTSSGTHMWIVFNVFVAFVYCVLIFIAWYSSCYDL